MEQQEPLSPAAAEAGTAALRIAVYDDPGRPPRLIIVTADTATALLETTAERVTGLVGELGGFVPGAAVREVIDNLIHADLAGGVVTILDSGNTVRISDRGPGVAEKDRARAAGFTTAGPREYAVVRGVGAGLSLASELMTRVNGTLEIDDNLGGGTVVTLRAPRAGITAALGESAGPDAAHLSERQLRALLLIVEMGPVGPTKIAKELAVSTSTAFRDLVALSESRFVQADRQGHRSATEEGLRFLQTVL